MLVLMNLVTCFFVSVYVNFLFGVMVYEEFEIHTEHPPQEAGWGEQNCGCLVLYLKCCCSNGYRIFLVGRNCFYKLT